MTTTTDLHTDHSLGFTSMEEEISVDSLRVQGSLPEWLEGKLVRVTPAKLEIGDDRLRHWFDGLAMLNAFSIDGGRVSYRSRFLDSHTYRQVRDEGKWPGVGGFAQDPCRSIFKRVASLFSERLDNCNVNLARIGERYIAMTETPMPVEFDPRTLETVGGLEYADSLGGQVTTAHPHHDSERDELVNYVAHMGPRNHYKVYGLPSGSRNRRLIASVRVKEPAYMHSFAMTERYVVLAEFPLVVNPLRMVFSGRPFIENYRWEPERGTRFLVIDRERGELTATCEGEPFFAFHHVNAFERDGELVLDVCAYEDDGVIRGLYLNREGLVGPLPFADLRRYRLSPEQGTAERETIAPGHLELPRIDYGRSAGRDYRFAYFAGAALEPGAGEFIDRLAKVDVREGSLRVWSEAGCFAGEPIFVRAPGADAEDSGVVLSVVLDSTAGRSFLLVLEASSFEEMARAEAPHHIPFGFHGQFFGGVS
jgi:beta,beta-carotene 9',10'-dioxygenase